MALSYIQGSVTQGGADAFAVASLATALSGISNIAYRVRELLFEIPRMTIVAAGNVEVALCRRTKAAMPNITDLDVIAKVKMGTELVGAAAGVAQEYVKRYAFSEDDELLIVEDPLYLAVDSNASTLTQTVYCRIGYERVNISAVDRLTLLTASLT
jgi:hypothetical protein